MEEEVLMIRNVQYGAVRLSNVLANLIVVNATQLVNKMKKKNT